MFQKLYKHLEEINRNTQHPPSNPMIQAEWAEKICERLDIINNTLSVQRRHPLSRKLVTGSILVACFGLLIAVLLTVYSLQLSKAARTSNERMAEIARASAVNNNNNREMGQKQLDISAKADRLDSVVQQQSQMITELKKLNETTLRAFTRMQKQINRQANGDKDRTVQDAAAK